MSLPVNDPSIEAVVERVRSDRECAIDAGLLIEVLVALGSLLAQ